MPSESLKLFSALTIRNIDSCVLETQIIPDDLRPWILPCLEDDPERFSCLEKQNRHVNHEVCLYTMAKHRDEDMPIVAAGLGNKDYLLYSYENGYCWTTEIAHHAAMYGHLDCLELMAGREYTNYDVTIDDIFEGVMVTEDLRLVIDTKRMRFRPWTDETAHRAALQGKLDCLKFLMSQGCEVDNFTVCMAAHYGQLECVVFMVEQGYGSAADTIEYATERGNLEIAKYLFENGFSWPRWATEKAARGGYFEILEYVVANGCPWSHRVTEHAAKNGDFKILKYAVDNGCPIDTELILSHAGITDEIRDYVMTLHSAEDQ